jgi:Flp pilus assembly protein TadG
MRRAFRKRSGSYLVETAATVAFAVPLTFYAIFVAVEACQVYGISQALQQAARAAARNLATTYAVDPGISSNTSDQIKFGFQPVVNDASKGALSNAIGSTDQFSAKFNFNTQPGTVTVTVDYASGQYGLPNFPEIDPLFLGKNYKMTQASSYNLE